MFKRMLVVFALLIGLLSASYAQNNDIKKFVGTWKGTMDMGGQVMTVIFKLEEKAGKLTGTGESPEQGGGPIPLDNVVVTANKLQFEITAVQAGFDGVYKEATKKIEGTLVINQQGIPLVLTQEKTDAPAVAVEKKYESIWEGSLATPQGNLRVVLKTFKNADGSLGAIALSPDQSEQEIPVSTITLTEDTLKFEATSVGASYTGKIDKATMTAKGTLSQGGGELPLELKKVDKPTEKK